jgi:hypothetical protein
MVIPAAAQPTPIVTPNPGRQFTDERGNLTGTGRVALQQLRNYVVNMNRFFPCNSSTTSNVITLTLLDVQPSLNQYSDYETFAFVADATSTGPVTALIVTATGTLGTLPVYKNNGAAQASTGDIAINLHYWLTYVDSLNGGNGGFVLR